MIDPIQYLFNTAPILYVIDFIEVFKGITSEMVSDPAVAHAMKLRKAWSFGNYKRFFQLYKSTPNCGRHLVDLFIDRERKAALKVITKAYVS